MPVTAVLDVGVDILSGTAMIDGKNPGEIAEWWNILPENVMKDTVPILDTKYVYRKVMYEIGK